ncbi:MAG TPA: GntR family transcriptional regulator [Propionibacteriaceae bacterium]|nr:GntR family transcriptional regulator [Propionibacteriaceae bacterium]
MPASSGEPSVPAVSLLRASIATPTPVPAYHRLEETLRQLIERQALLPGEQLPTEQQLADCLGISRPTVRHALQRLERANLIHRERGKGTFVRSNPANPSAH